MIVSVEFAGTAPKLVGANVTCIPTLPPALSVLGTVSPAKVNDAGRLIELIVRLLVPVLVTVTTCGALVVHAGTIPKLSEFGVAVIVDPDEVGMLLEQETSERPEKAKRTATRIFLAVSDFTKIIPFNPTEPSILETI